MMRVMSLQAQTLETKRAPPAVKSLASSKAPSHPRQGGLLIAAQACILEFRTQELGKQLRSGVLGKLQRKQRISTDSESTECGPLPRGLEGDGAGLEERERERRELGDDRVAAPVHHSGRQIMPSEPDPIIMIAMSMMSDLHVRCRRSISPSNGGFLRSADSKTVFWRRVWVQPDLIRRGLSESRCPRFRARR